jgi:hypothetical protein
MNRRSLAVALLAVLLCLQAPETFGATSAKPDSESSFRERVMRIVRSFPKLIPKAFTDYPTPPKP